MTTRFPNTGRVAQAFQYRWVEKPENCSQEEAIEKFRQALHQSKGKCNTRMGVEIACLKSATVDDIARLGTINPDKVPDYRDKAVTTDRQSKMTPYDRVRRQSIARHTRLSDTTLGRLLKKTGLWESVAHLDKADMNTIRANSFGSYDQEWNLMSMAMFFALNDGSRVAEHYPAMSQHISKHIRVEKKDADPNTEFGRRCITFYNARKEMLKHDTKWLNSLTDEQLKELNSAMDGRSWLHPVTFTEAYYTSSTAFNDVNVELGHMFMEAMDYMGLGVYQEFDKENPYYRSNVSFSHKGIVPLVKKVLASQRHFNAMLKQGYDVSMVREETILDIENYISGRTNLKWKFFVLKDAPTEYEVAKQKSVKKERKPKVERPKTIKVGNFELAVQE